VRACNEETIGAQSDVCSTNTRTRLMSPAIFFGFGVDTVRYALELQPACLAAIMPTYFFSTYPMCSSLPSYRPRFHLPTLVSADDAFYNIIFVYNYINYCELTYLVDSISRGA
jgi:hypothetical protein